MIVIPCTYVEKNRSGRFSVWYKVLRYRSSLAYWNSLLKSPIIELIVLLHLMNVVWKTYTFLLLCTKAPNIASHLSYQVIVQRSNSASSWTVTSVYEAYSHHHNVICCGYTNILGSWNSALMYWNITIHANSTSVSDSRSCCVCWCIR